MRWSKVLVVMWRLLFLTPVVCAEPVLQVTPQVVDFGEVQVYSTEIKTQKITISNCGESDSVLCWGIQANDAWLTVEGQTKGEINLPRGDKKYVEESLGACGLCVAVDLAGDEIVGKHQGSFTIYQYVYDESGTEPQCTDIVDTTIKDGQVVPIAVTVSATMTIPENNILEVDPVELDFGAEEDEISFQVKNAGDGEMAWEVSMIGDVDWLTVEDGTTVSGQVEGGFSDTVTLRADRSKVTGCNDKYSATIKVTSPNALPGEVSVSVTMEKNIVPPNPTSPFPVDGADDQSLYSTLKWQENPTPGSLGGVVYYDVYFSQEQSQVESNSPSVLVCDDIVVPYCDPTGGGGYLSTKTTYYWKVKAIDECKENEVYSEVWKFTTGEAPLTTCPISMLFNLAEDEHTLLRTFRDEVLTKTSRGKRYVTLYYSPQGLEALLILLFNPELRMCADRIAKEFLPVIHSLVQGEISYIDPEREAVLCSFLDEIEKEASPELSATIKDVKNDLRSGVLFKTLKRYSP